MTRLTLYGRRECHLCHELESRLRALLQEFTFTYQVIDVDSDPDLTQRYGARVPVLVSGGQELAGLSTETPSLRRFLGQVTRTPIDPGNAH